MVVRHDGRVQQAVIPEVGWKGCIIVYSTHWVGCNLSSAAFEKVEPLSWYLSPDLLNVDVKS